LLRKKLTHTKKDTQTVRRNQVHNQPPG